MSPLAADIAQFMAAGSPSDADFEALAARLIAHQAGAFPFWERYARTHGRTLFGSPTWQNIAPMPIAAFKHALLHDGQNAIVHTFESSGTSGAPRSRSAFSREGLALMDLAIDVAATRWLFPEGRTTRILVLAPPPEQAPGMIMAYGMRRLIERFGLPGTDFLVGVGGLDVARIIAVLTEAAASGVPVTVIGASFGFVHLLDGFARTGLRIQCAPGSRTLDAGGFKGRSRVVTRAELDQAIHAGLGIPPERVINLLGMTELPSQFYDGTLALDPSPEARLKQNPHWTRTRVLNPWTLEDASPGEVGLLAHWDLASLERPFAILTDDLGRRLPGGFEVLGRADETDAKGCSISLDELLEARR